MNSQDLSNLQEAYLDVYISEGEKPLPYGRMIKKSDELADSDDKDKQKRAAKIYLTANAPKGPKIKVKEQVDIYDIILSHLLDEGYADTPEAAEAIMVSMSEEWREEIVEAYVPYEGKPQEKLRAKQNKLADRWDKPGSEQRFHKMGAVDSKMTNPEQKKYRETVNTQRDLAVKRRGTNP